MSPPSILVSTFSIDDLRVVVREELRNALAEHASSEGMPGLVDRHELARLLGVSPATVTRLTKEGAPVTYVGQSPRYDVAAFRAWLAERGRRETKAPSRRENIAGVRLLSQRRS